MTDEFQQKKKRLDNLLANGNIGKNEYDRFISLLNQQNTTPAATQDNDPTATHVDAQQDNSSGPEPHHEKKGCLNRDVFELMKSKGIITEQEFINIDRKYFNAKTPNPVAVDNHMSKKKKVVLAVIAIALLIIILTIACGTGQNTGGVSSSQQPQENNDAVSESAQQQSNDSESDAAVDEQADAAKDEDNDTATEQSAAQYDQEAVRKAFEKYVNLWANAVNNQNFSIVSPCLKEGSSLYNQQNKLLSVLSKQGIREEFLTGQFSSSFNSSKNVIEGQAYEKYKIIYPSGSAKYIDNYFVYTIAPLEPYKIMSISKGQDPYKNTSTEDGWVTSDGTQLKLDASDKSDTLATLSKDDKIVIMEHTVADDGSNWVHVKHPTYGLSWIREENVTWPDI